MLYNYPTNNINKKNIWCINHESSYKHLVKKAGMKQYGLSKGKLLEISFNYSMLLMYQFE